MKRRVLKRVGAVQEKVIEKKINEAISSGGISKSVTEMKMLGDSQKAIEELRKAKKALDHSIDKMYELYLMLISMVAEMQGLAIDKIESGRKKQLPTQEDLHPNTKFVRNTPLRILANSKKLKTIQHVREYQVTIMNKPFMEFSYKTPLTKAQYIKMH